MLGAWCSVMIRSAIILAAALMLCRLPRWPSPSDRHRVLLTGFGMLALWPLLAAWLPEVAVTLWSAANAGDHVTVRQTVFALRSQATPLFNWPLTLWAIGFLCVLTPTAVGYLSVLRMANRATLLSDPLWDGILDEVCASLKLKSRPKLLLHAGPVMPMTFGVFLPRVMLPDGCLSWSPAKSRIVLIHEVAHIERRDFCAQLLANMVAAVWWFQPLCWINRWRLRRESERACDASVLTAGVRPSDYAALLLEIAQSLSARQPWSGVAVSMARPGGLEGRLSEILDGARSVSAPRATFAAVSALVVTTAAASAVTLLPFQQAHRSGDSFMNRTLLSGLLASAGLSAATIGGSLSDPSGVAVASAKAQLYNPDTAAKQETTTATDGKFVFDNLPAGQYILRIEAPGFASLFREFNVKQESNVDRRLMLNVAQVQTGLPPSGEPAVPESSNPYQLRVAGKDQQEKLTYKVQPHYPASAKAAGLQGVVNLEMVISADGVPQDIRVVSSPGDDLSQSALEAVRQWRYSTTLLNGQPVEVLSHATVTYTLAR